MHLCNVLEIKQKNPKVSNPSQLVLLLLCCYTQNISYHNRVSNFGSVALQNTKCNVNPGLSHFEWCALACAHLLANLHLHLCFAFRQSKATLPLQGTNHNQVGKVDTRYLITSIFQIRLQESSRSPIPVHGLDVLNTNC